MTTLIEIIKWLGCCLVLPVVLLFFLWPVILFYTGFTKLTALIILIGWYSILTGTGIYFSDKYIGN